MSRGWVWLQMGVAWLPIWALFTAIIVIMHGVPLGWAVVSALRMIGAAAVLGIAVYKFSARTPWPYPFELRFVAVHLLGACIYAFAWFALTSLIDSLVYRHLILAIGPGLSVTMITGCWLYLMVAGVAYANLAAQRTAKIEAQAAHMQLDTLRSQLHPHFLFNALHTVVQLIPTDPRAAAQAAEQLAGVLRSTIEERRDLISLAQEWAFVERYLAIETIRFGDRLEIQVHIDDSARSALLPSFALQTLIENAVRHGAAPRIEATQVRISATLCDETLTLVVSDNGIGARVEDIETSAGTGLRRLRERMRWLYGNRARLDLTSTPGSGFSASLIVPQLADDEINGDARAREQEA